MEKPDRTEGAWCEVKDGRLICMAEYPGLQRKCCYYQHSSRANRYCMFGIVGQGGFDCLSQRAYNDFDLGNVSELERLHTMTSSRAQSIIDANTPYLPEGGPIESAMKRKDEEKKQKAIEALQRFIEG
jgi:hypothetical protein